MSLFHFRDLRYFSSSLYPFISCVWYSLWLRLSQKSEVFHILVSKYLEILGPFTLIYLIVGLSLHLSYIRLHTAINRADFVSWWMWFNGSPTKVQRHFLTIAFRLPSYVYNMHQDTKSARLIAVCKRSFVLIDFLSLFFLSLVVEPLIPPLSASTYSNGLTLLNLTLTFLHYIHCRYSSQIFDRLDVDCRDCFVSGSFLASRVPINWVYLPILFLNLVCRKISTIL